MPNEYGEALKKQNSIKAVVPTSSLYAAVYAEAAGGSPEEVAAVASAFLNRASEVGLEKALKSSSAYTKKSKQYMKAFSGDLNEYEQKKYEEYKGIVDSLISNPSSITPYTHFENVGAYGEPSWADEMGQWKDIGRQRFYMK